MRSALPVKPACAAMIRRARHAISAQRLAIIAASGVILAHAGVASAEITSFQASVTSTLTRPSGGCSNGAYLCGTATIAGYGSASWNLYVTGNTNVLSPCGSTYQAFTEFVLASDPNSTLVLDESGELCGLGHDGAAYRGYFSGGSQDFGHPFAAVGNWTVDATSSGQFAGRVGSGTDELNIAGAHAAGSYSGTLG